MSTSLTVIPETYGGMPGTCEAYTRLGFDNRYAVWADIKKAATRSPVKLRWYGDNGLETVATDAQGNGLRIIRVVAFLELWDAAKIDECCICPWDKAIIAFLRALSGGHRVFLWFS